MFLARQHPQEYPQPRLAYLLAQATRSGKFPTWDLNPAFEANGLKVNATKSRLRKPELRTPGAGRAGSAGRPQLLRQPFHPHRRPDSRGLQCPGEVGAGTGGVPRGWGRRGGETGHRVRGGAPCDAHGRRRTRTLPLTCRRAFPTAQPAPPRSPQHRPQASLPVCRGGAEARRNWPHPAAGLGC